MAHPQTPPTFNPVTTGSDEYSVELNDANITAKAWKSSRYDGSKTETAVLNKYSEGDISVGKTTAVQKYSRNIYLGNDIIGMDGGGEDGLLFNFPAFSYATTIKYFTVNGDNSISNDIVESKPDDFDSRRGFYRSFYEDFKQGTSCKVIINDISIKTNLKDSYPIYFNGGQLQKVFSLTTDKTVTNVSQYYQPLNIPQSQSYEIFGVGPDRALGCQLQYYNQNIIGEFYSGSLEFIGNTTSLISDGNNFISKALNFRDNSIYRNDKRIFVSFCTQSGIPIDPSDGSEFKSLRTIFAVNISASKAIQPTKNLAELSTTELSSLPGGNNKLDLLFSNTFILNQSYYGGGADTDNPNTEISPSTFENGTLMFSKLEDANPSLLLNLPKNEHIPNGIGANGFVIIPDNLHPHIKKNLTHFLAKAGIPLGVDTIPALDTTFERLS